MTDSLPTVYKADPHTRAKHQILEAYLKRWAVILDRNARRFQRTHRRLLYFDGFAGAGEYEGAIRGSPQVPIDVVESHQHQFACPIEIRLVERRPDRATHLKNVIAQKKASILRASNLRVLDPIEGDCEEEIRRLLAECRRTGEELGPAFFFLDQFGYSSISLETIRELLSHRMCETLSYMNWNMLLPFITDESKHPGLTRAFGSEAWREVLSLSGVAKERRFCALYLDALRSAGATYSIPFTMRGADDRVLYWVFFCTKSRRGLEEMKQAMLEVDGSGMFQFSDKHAGSLGSLWNYGERQLIDDIGERFDGQVLTVKELYEYALVHTPAIKVYSALGSMESEGKLEAIEPPVGRQRRSFKPHPEMRVRVLRQAAGDSRTLWSDLSDSSSESGRATG